MWGGLWLFSPAHTFFFAPNQKQTFFFLSGKGTSKVAPLHIISFFCQFCEQTFYFLPFAEQTIFLLLFATQFFFNPIAPPRIIWSAPYVSMAQTTSVWNLHNPSPCVVHAMHRSRTATCSTENRSLLVTAKAMFCVYLFYLFCVHGFVKHVKLQTAHLSTVLVKLTCCGPQVAALTDTKSIHY